MTVFVFPDIETTGLKPSYDKVLEVAWRITDGRFGEIGTPRTFIVEHGSEWNEVWSLLGQSGFVSDMHKHSGLWADLHSKHAYDMHGIAKAFRDDIEKALKLDGTEQAHLAGLSVGFDREFLSAENAFEDIFDGIVHHRILDLSSIKLMWQSLGWAIPEIINLHPHRALADVGEALSFARAIRSELQIVDHAAYLDEGI